MGLFLSFVLASVLSVAKDRTQHWEATSARVCISFMVYVILYHVPYLPLPICSNARIRTTIDFPFRFCLSAAEAEPGGDGET